MISKDKVKNWFRNQTVNQVILIKNQKIAYHKIIGDGDGGIFKEKGFY